MMNDLLPYDMLLLEPLRWSSSISQFYNHVVQEEVACEGMICSPGDDASIQSRFECRVYSKVPIKTLWKIVGTVNQRT